MTTLAETRHSEGSRGKSLDTRRFCKTWLCVVAALGLAWLGLILANAL